LAVTFARESGFAATAPALDKRRRGHYDPSRAASLRRGIT
jgi:hypothetical protein